MEKKDSRDRGVKRREKKNNSTGLGASMNWVEVISQSREKSAGGIALSMDEIILGLSCQRLSAGLLQYSAIMLSLGSK